MIIGVRDSFACFFLYPTSHQNLFPSPFLFLFSLPPPLFFFLSPSLPPFFPSSFTVYQADYAYEGMILNTCNYWQGDWPVRRNIGFGKGSRFSKPSPVPGIDSSFARLGREVVLGVQERAGEWGRHRGEWVVVSGKGLLTNKHRRVLIF